MVPHLAVLVSSHDIHLDVMTSIRSPRRRAEADTAVPTSLEF